MVVCCILLAVFCLWLRQLIGMVARYQRVADYKVGRVHQQHLTSRPVRPRYTPSLPDLDLDLEKGGGRRSRSRHRSRSRSRSKNRQETKQQVAPVAVAEEIDLDEDVPSEGQAAAERALQEMEEDLLQEAERIQLPSP